MAENHLDYRYLDGELMGEHFAEDPELLAIKARVQELEMEDYEKLKEEDKCDVEEMQHQTSNSWPGPFYNMTPEERIDADNRSIYVGNVDYGATADELEIHFNGCGPVNRVTILCDRFSGHPKGFAYIEFSDRDSVQSAIGLHETVFRGRVLKHHIKQILHLVHPPFTGWAYEAIISSKIVLVLPKRTNMPGISTTDRGGHRGGQSRGRGRGHHPPRYQNSSRGRYRYQSTRPQHQSPHPYYGGPPAGKRQWGHMDYHEQTPKRNPCLLLITPPSEDLGAVSSGQHYPQQR